MCAIVGLVVKEEISNADRDLLKRIFLESKIRGLHATGISWVDSGLIRTEKFPVGADIFVNQFDFGKLIGKMFIGHCRYSTSDLEWNQPIADEKLSLVHNGVVTQESSENWPIHFGGSYLTKNDTEIFFNRYKEGENPFLRLPNASGAVLTLSNERLTAFRNGKRPLWVTEMDSGWVLTSTKDIAIRSNLIGPIFSIDIGIEYRFTESGLNKISSFIGKDWQ